MNSKLKKNRLYALFNIPAKGLATLIIGLSSLVLSSQSLDIKGKVTDNSGIPMLGVNVLNENTGKGVVTDFDGNYAIQANPGDWLIFSYVSFSEKRVQVKESGNIPVTLEESSELLDDVVVVGYGSIKSSKISSAVSQLDSESLNNSTFARVDQAMAGKIAGVQVQEVTGSPGADPDIKIRGISSISNSNGPLFVVDGFPISGNLGTINPKDVQSIEVLKDAASAAIYGSRGANGVVLITTKQGSLGKSNISFSTTLGFQSQLKEVGLLNREEYLEFAIEERTNSAIYQGIDPSTLTSLPPAPNYAIDPEWISNPSSFPDNNWQDLINRIAPIRTYQLSASGMSDKFKYYSSINYLDQLGIINETSFKRISFQSNLEGKALKFLTLGLNLNISNSLRENPNVDTAGGAISRSILMAPIVGIDMQSENTGYYPYHASFVLNPITLSEEIDNNSDKLRILANTYLELNPLENLKLRTSIGFDLQRTTEDYFITNNINRGRGSMGNAGNRNIDNFLTETTLTYTNNLDKFGINILSGFSFQKERFRNYFMEKTGFPDDEIKTLNAATNIVSATSTATEWALASYFGRLNIDYDDKYILTASLRTDGSSRFGSNKKWGLFPALSAGWNVDREKFMRNSNTISSAKLRASYGSTGNNNIGNYSSTARLSQNNYVDEQGNVVTGYAVNGFSNQNLTWETTDIIDFGIDLGFWKDRFNLTADYYISNTSDLLLDIPIPGITGYVSTLQNIGRVVNKGFEIEFKSTNISGDFNWTTFLNISHNENEVKELGPEGSPIYGSSAGFVVTKTEIGKPIGSYYMLETDGVFLNQEEVDNNPTYNRQEPGDLKYVDQNGDGEITFEDDRKHLGSNLPKYTYGISNEFSYKDFTLSVFMDGQVGNKLLNIAIKEHGQSRSNVYDYWLNRWRSPEDPGDGKTPRAAVTENLTTASDFWLRDAGFWRIKNVSLAYQFPEEILNKLKVFSSMKIYFNIDNLMMVDEYDGNVQTGAYSNSALVPGVQRDATYPLARTFTLGFDVIF